MLFLGPYIIDISHFSTTNQQTNMVTNTATVKAVDGSLQLPYKSPSHGQAHDSRP